MISPFVGRIYDWYKESAGNGWDDLANVGAEDPGVKSVRQIYCYYKQHGIPTEVMAASFRNTCQILALARCDLLTIGTNLLAELAASDAPISRSLYAPAAAVVPPMDRIVLDEPAFRFAMNQDAMATEKLAEGIRQFAVDPTALDQLIDSCIVGAQ